MSKLSLIAALALGGLMACSTLATAADTPPAKKGGKNRPTVEQQMKRMTDTLSLTSDQQPKVLPLLKATSTAMQDMRKDNLDQQARREQMQKIMDTQNKAMHEILTPEQYTKYLQMNRRGKKGSKNADDKSK